MDYISQEVTVDELPFQGLFVKQKDNVLCLAERPDWVRDPQTGQRLYVSSMSVSESLVTCPVCKLENYHGIITFMDSPKFVIACSKCKNFVWMEPTK